MDGVINNLSNCVNASLSCNGSISGVNDPEVPNIYMDVSWIVVPVLFACIFIVGTVGNGTLLIIVLRNKNMRTTPNIFILSLALGDLLLILVSVPFFATIYTVPGWPHGDFLCKMNGFLKALSLGVSVFTLTALSGDRYVASTYPMQRHMESHKPQTYIITVLIWILSIALAFLEGSIIHVSESLYSDAQGLPYKVCTSDKLQWGTWFPCFRACMRFTIYFLIPIVIISILYSMMARSLWMSHTDIPMETPAIAGMLQGPAAARQAEARKKIAKLVLAIVILFIICWLPRHVFLLWFQCPSPGDYNIFWHVWKITSYCLCFMNSCVNPLALYILSDQYRRYFNRYLCCGWRKGSTHRTCQRQGTGNNQWQQASLSTTRSCRTSNGLLMRANTKDTIELQL